MKITLFQDLNFPRSTEITSFDKYLLFFESKIKVNVAKNVSDKSELKCAPVFTFRRSRFCNWRYSQIGKLVKYKTCGV
jgi:hypothetical protein